MKSFIFWHVTKHRENCCTVLFNNPDVLFGTEKKNRLTIEDSVLTTQFQYKWLLVLFRIFPLPETVTVWRLLLIFKPTTFTRLSTHCTESQSQLSPGVTEANLHRTWKMGHHGDDDAWGHEKILLGNDDCFQFRI